MKYVGTGHADTTKLSIQTFASDQCEHYSGLSLVSAFANRIEWIGVMLFGLRLVCISDWAVNQHRDSYASYISHSDLLDYFSIAQGQTRARMKLQFYHVSSPCPDGYTRTRTRQSSLHISMFIQHAWPELTWPDLTWACCGCQMWSWPCNLFFFIENGPTLWRERDAFGATC